MFILLLNLFKRRVWSRIYHFRVILALRPQLIVHHIVDIVYPLAWVAFQRMFLDVFRSACSTKLTRQNLGHSSEKLLRFFCSERDPMKQLPSTWTPKASVHPNYILVRKLKWRAPMLSYSAFPNRGFIRIGSWVLRLEILLEQSSLLYSRPISRIRAYGGIWSYGSCWEKYFIGFSEHLLRF